MDIQARWLIFHSSIVLLVGLLVGGAYGRAIGRGAPTHVVNAWRLAHAALPIGACVGLAVGAVLSALSIGAVAKSWLSYSWIVSNYAFCFSLPLAAIVGQRGLNAAEPLSNRLVFIGNAVGAAASLAGAVILVYGAYLSL